MSRSGVSLESAMARAGGPRRRRWNVTPWLYVLPALAVIGFIFVYPLTQLVGLSMQQVYGYTSQFVGAANFGLVIGDPSFQVAVEHNLALLLCVPVLVALSIFFAILLYEKTRGWRLYRTTLFLPYVLSIPVVAVVFSYLLQLNGLVNTVLIWLHLGFLAQDWLGSDRWAFPTLMGIIIWKELGFGIILFLARLLSLPAELFDAAKVDGAGWWRLHRHITVPQLRGVIEFYVVVEGITMLSWVFNYVFVVSQGTGGPGTSTMVTELYIYRQAFGYGSSEFGLAAAAAVLIFAATLLLMVVNARVRRVSLHE